MSRNADYSDWSKTELVKEIRKLNEQEKYGLVWNKEKTKEVFEKESQGKLPVLTENVGKSISGDKNKLIKYNVLIEGDNYHALSVLNYTHGGKIDVIYIDPPYNTGSGFRYNDHKIEKDDAYRHSKWLSFMNKRLKLAKRLLSNKGVIFISIDENEYSQLKLLSDEIFGHKNYVGSFVWRKKAGAGADSKLLFSQHEYVLFYAKNIEYQTAFFEPLTEKQKFEYKNPDNDPKGLWAPTDLTAPSSDTDESRHYEITSPTGKRWKKRWSYTKKNMDELIKNNLVWFGKNGSTQPKRKRYLSDKLGLVPRSLIMFALTLDGKKDFENIFGKKNTHKFNYPKPVSFIQHFLRIASQKNSIILDFFAGSGTTGQAVLNLNKEDSGNRQFILCTNNEDDICVNTCYPRLKKVIEGYENLKGENVRGLGGNLKYFKTAFVDSEPTDQNKKIIVSQSTEMLCLKEDCFELIKEGKQFKIFKNHDGSHMGIVYYYDGIIPFKKEVLKLKVKINTYVFSLVDKVDSEDFIDIYPWVTLKPIPSAILNVYRRIYVNVRFKKLSGKTHN